MFIIKNTITGRKHSEPSRPSWKGTEYKTQAAAKAGVTRTIKHYQKAVLSVSECVANGEPEYMSRYYNDYKDVAYAPSEFGGRSDRRGLLDGSILEVMSVADYGNPEVTRTGTSPYNGNEITVTIDINQVGTHMDPLCESHYTR